MKAVHGRNLRQSTGHLKTIQLKTFTLESQSQPKRGVARTEKVDMMRKARAILVMGKSRLVDRKGDRVA